MIIRVTLIVVAFIGIDVYGAVKPDYFGGLYKVPGESRFLSTGFPDGVHPKDCSPDKIRIDHIIPLLATYEKNLHKGTLRQALEFDPELAYLLSYIGDERFTSLIYDQYAERLFEEFGNKEESVVLLYYKTGGSLEKLQALYQQPINNNIKQAIEACFFDASVGLLENHEQDAGDAASQPLSVKLSTKFRTMKYYTTDLVGDPPARELFGTPPTGIDGDGYMYEGTTDDRDLYIEYENTTKNMFIRIEIPRRTYRRCWCEFNVTRNGGIPVLTTEPWSTHEHEKQFLTLYPGDRYIRKMDLNFSIKDPGHIAAQLFSDFGKYGVVLGDYWVGNAEDEFRVTLNYKCNYIAAKSLEDLNHITESDWKTIRSNSLELPYAPSKGCKTRVDKERAWENVMKSWKDIP